MSCIYVIRCAHGKYYVGRTIDVVSRFNAHARGLGAVWTRAHLPLDGIVELHPDAEFHELVITLKTMKTYGIENVRGGPWCSLVLSATELETITEMMRSEGFARPETRPDTVVTMTDDEPKSRKGHKWDSMEDASLLQELVQNLSAAEIATRHARTEGAIKTRVAHHATLLATEGKAVSDIASILHLTQADVHLCLHRRLPEMIVSPGCP